MSQTRGRIDWNESKIFNKSFSKTMCQGKARILFKFEKADCKIKCFY